MTKKEKIALKTIIYVFFLAVNVYLVTDMLRLHNERGFELFSIDSPALYPLFIAVIMFIVILISLWVDIKALKKENEAANAKKDTVPIETPIEGTTSPEAKEKKSFYKAVVASLDKYNILRVALTSAGLIAYVFIMKELGFIITTAFMLFIYTMLLYKNPSILKKIVICLVSAVALTVVLWLVFSKIFGVLLP